MNITFQIFKLTIVFCIIFFSCKSYKTSEEVDEFAIFIASEIFDSIKGCNEMVPSVKRN